MTPPTVLEDWMTYAEVSRILCVSVKRLQNLVSLHKLERQHRWIGRAPHRRRIARLSPTTVRTLATLTKNSFLVSH